MVAPTRPGWRLRLRRAVCLTQLDKLNATLGYLRAAQEAMEHHRVVLAELGEPTADLEARLCDNARFTAEIRCKVQAAADRLAATY